MSDYAAVYNLKGIIHDDSWRGIPLIQIIVNAAPPTVAIASAEMIFKKRSKQSTNDLVLTSSGATPTIIINDDVTWDLTIPRILDFPLAAGVWHYVFKTIDIDGFKRTYFGGTITLTDEP
jgi:hypothetical protein